MDKLSSGAIVLLLSNVGCSFDAESNPRALKLCNRRLIWFDFQLFWLNGSRLSPNTASNVPTICPTLCSVPHVKTNTKPWQSIRPCVPEWLMFKLKYKLYFSSSELQKASTAAAPKCCSSIRHCWFSKNCTEHLQSDQKSSICKRFELSCS